jgi:hypothetical protein
VSAGALEITWLKNGEILFREIAHGVPPDTAIVGAWLDLPRIAQMTGGEPDRIEFHDPVTGRTTAEDVPQHTRPSALAVLTRHLLIGIAVLIVVFLLSSSGHTGAAAAVFEQALALLPEFAVGGITAFLWAREQDRKARRRWTGAPERKA